MRVSEIRVKRIRVNQGLGVVLFIKKEIQVQFQNGSDRFVWHRTYVD